MPKNTQSTRAFSSKQEEYVSKLLGGDRTPNSGAGDWVKGDIQIKSASTLCECKTCMTDKDSFSIKKSWLEKNAQEARLTHFTNSILAFNFGPNSKNYFVIDENLAKFLINKLNEEYA